MEQRMIFSSPIQNDYGINNMVVTPASSARSPTCVIFAVDDEQLGGVFRLLGHNADDATAERRCQPEQDQQAGGTTGFLHSTRCLTSSYANQELVELSTFSDEESSSSSSSSDDCSVDHRYLYLPTRRRRAAPIMSIFRPMSGTKRRCDFGEEDHQYFRSSSDDDGRDGEEGDRRDTPTKRPSLRHANPVRSGEHEHDAHVAEISLSSTYSYVSALKRICRSASSSSSFSSLLAAGEEGSSVSPIAASTIGNSRSGDDATAVSTMTIFEHLQHPQSSLVITPSEDIEFHHNPKDDNEEI